MQDEKLRVIDHALFRRVMGSFATGVGLAVYGNWFLRKMKGIV